VKLRVQKITLSVFRKNRNCWTLESRKFEYWDPY